MAADAGVVAAVVADAAGIDMAATLEPQYVPRSFQMQWHITEHCNLRCSHCYQNTYEQADLPFDSLVQIFRQFVDTVETFRRESGRNIPARITLTGGEPFLRSDFFELLEIVASHRKQLRFAILTNGTMIDRDTAKRIACFKPDYVQVSIDGLRETHDTLRAPGSFDLATEGIRRLVEQHVCTIVSFTTSRRNAVEFPAVARWAAQLGVQRIWADRLIPTTPEQHRDVLSPEETREFFEQMHAVRTVLQTQTYAGWFKRIFLQYISRRGSVTEVAMHRALQFLVGGGIIYRCSAGDSLVAVLPDGTLLPCRRMPIPVGNVLQRPLVELYHRSEILRRLRENRCPKECAGCIYAEHCGGGLRCLAHAMTGNSLMPDPGCQLR